MDGTPGAAPLKPMTRRQKVFVEKYLQYWNASRAAEEAGFAVPQVKSAYLMKMPHIQAAIAERMKQMTMDADEVLTRLGQQARLNASMFFHFGWVPMKDRQGQHIKDKSGEIIKTYEMLGINWEMFEEYGYLVKKLSYDRKGRPVIEFHDAQNALMLIGKAHRLFVDRMENTNFNVDVSADELAAARNKARQFEENLQSGETVSDP
jgi:hypothetical protein